MNKHEALLHHAKSHKLLPRDIIKFLYQAEFGCGHLIPDFTDAHERFCAEWDSAAPNGEPVFEPLGNGFCRINLYAAKESGLPRSMVLRMFFESALVCGNREHLCTELERAYESAEKRELKVSAKALRAEIESFKENGMPMVSHSAEYRARYKPAYRVIKADFCRYLPLFKSIFELLPQNAAPLIVIDGMAAAGKTTLSALIASIIPCNVVHADSFFLPSELRTPERLAEPGGLLHYERLKQEVTDRLCGADNFEYRIFNCRIMDYDESAKVMAGLPVVLEGSYSSHPALCAAPSIKVFIKTTPIKQAERILSRNGKGILARFVEEWIPAENAFFAKYNTEKNSDFVFET